MKTIKTTLKAMKQLVEMGYAVDISYADEMPAEKFNVIAYAISTYGWVNGVIAKGNESGKTYVCTRTNHLFNVMGF